nr:hypothetical protein [Phaeobacter sp. 22II1-1F12B]
MLAFDLGIKDESQFTFAATAAGTKISTGDGEILLDGVAPVDLGAQDFLFV